MTAICLCILNLRGLIATQELIKHEAVVNRLSSLLLLFEEGRLPVNLASKSPTNSFKNVFTDLSAAWR